MNSDLLQRPRHISILAVGCLAISLLFGLYGWNPEPIPGMAFAPPVTVNHGALNSKSSEREIRFAQDILPILSNKCFRCHGPDENTREAGLRLDVREDAIDYEAIVPGHIDESEMIVRVTSDDEDLQMPPPGEGIEPLTQIEIETIKTWIQQGAKWQKHWSFVPPKSPQLPTVIQKEWVKNPIDQFVLAKLEQEGLKPSARAAKSTLLRRVSLLITGLPPSPQLAEQFLNDSSPNAYEKLVDQLLASGAYGERMAAAWMNLARYSDTDGFQADEPRTNWPWREWVVNAYNANMSFDQFTIEQFAGDLLPNATDTQVLATCFHRNHMTNGEGGRDPEESRVDYVLDRVNTVGTAWLGLTLGCAQCHTHKYDPITQKEYYQLTAFFNSIDEDGRAGRSAKPYLNWKLDDTELLLRQPQQQLARRQNELNEKREIANKAFDGWLNDLLVNRKQQVQYVEQSAWESIRFSDWSASDPSIQLEPEEDHVWRQTAGNPNNVTYQMRTDLVPAKVGAIRLEVLPHRSFTQQGLAKSNSGNFVLSDFSAHLVRKNQNEVERIALPFKSAWADYAQPGFPVRYAIDSVADNGWAVLSGKMNQPRTAIFRLDQVVDVKEGDRLEIELRHFSHHVHHNIGRFRISTSPYEKASHKTLVTETLSQVGDSKSFTAAQKELLREYFVTHDGHVGVAEAQVEIARKRLEQAKKNNSISVMVLKEREEPRETFVLKRGVWDAHGDRVESGTPVAISPKLSTSRASRLDLAKWIVDRANPLTARVAVNRYWQMYFGAGLVRTPQDFGLQGEHPTHPDLLDWLAVEFMENDWNVKRIHRLIATSATFQQSSAVDDSLLQTDPNNRLLARGPRFRMPAFMIRDNSLSVSGLLSRRMGGPPVKPYQPENVWAASDQGRYPYTLSKGEDLYRRSLYTYWRRNIAPPGMFDAAQRRVCEIKTRRTNSPMHALVLMNDTTYIEAARSLATSALRQGLPTDSETLQWIYQRTLFRNPTAEEESRLSKSWNALKVEYHAQPELAKQLLNQGALPIEEDLDVPTLASLTIVASTILNLDESLNIE